MVRPRPSPNAGLRPPGIGTLIREFPDGFSRLLAMIAQWASGPEGLDRFRRQGRLCGHGGFRGTFLLDLGEGLAGSGVGRLELGGGGESPDDHVAVARIELDAVEDTRQRPQSLYGLIFD